MSLFSELGLEIENNPCLWRGFVFVENKIIFASYSPYGVMRQAL